MLNSLAAFTALSVARLISIEPNISFPSETGGQFEKVYEGLNPNIDFNEVIASWNVQRANGSALQVEIRAHGQDYQTPWYTLGKWSLEPSDAPRTSVADQEDNFAKVAIDTLVLKSLAKSVDLRVTLSSPKPNVSCLKLITLSFASTGSNVLGESTVAHPAWGKQIDVPKRAQSDYPGGRSSWCSPTSVSMVLSHWSRILNDPSLDHDVPEVQSHVFDFGAQISGNWPFNAAYPGSLPRMRAYVSRFNQIEDLEAWIDKGLPVITSVAYSLTQGKPLSKTEAGHLMVLVGFTKEGDPIFNDPGHRDMIRRPFKRADFELGWRYSNRTVYLVYPENSVVPEDPWGLWVN